MQIKTKNKGGRPTQYKEEYCNQIVEFFQIEPYMTEEVEVTTALGSKYKKKVRHANDLKFLLDFAKEINISYRTVRRWTESHSEFCHAYKEAKDLQERQLIVNGLNGLYQTSFAIFTAKNILKYLLALNNILKLNSNPQW